MVNTIANLYFVLFYDYGPEKKIYFKISVKCKKNLIYMCFIYTVIKKETLNFFVKFLTK